MIQAVDLFCGAGGTSSGILKAAARLDKHIKLTAVNHWQTAINTHSLNHPQVKHICEPVENIHPLDLVKSGHLHLLAASCECRFHSNARGGGPCNEQSRSQPWQLIRWATDVRVDNIIMENVREFMNWGPLNKRTKRPIKSKKGEYFRAFVNALGNIFDDVQWKVQVCADFGDATTRPRLILMATRGRKVQWPEPTHGEGRSKPWQPFRKHWDRSIPGKSIFNEDGSFRLCKNTIKRIIAGFEKQGAVAEPILMILRGTSNSHINSCSRSVYEPLPSITTSGTHFWICEPIMLTLDRPITNRSRARSLDQPLPTVTSSQRIALIEPIIVQTDQQGGNGSYSRSIDRPLPTVVTKQNLLLVQPMVMKFYKSGICKPIDEPIDTITTKGRFMLVEPTTGQRCGYDIIARMVQPHELAACHSFPPTYKFTGNKADQTKQIGNSVPVELAAAHAEAVLK